MRKYTRVSKKTRSLAFILVMVMLMKPLPLAMKLDVYAVPPIPTVIDPLSNTTITFGDTSATFSVTANGDGELKYQWFRNNGALHSPAPGNSTYVETNLTFLTPQSTPDIYHCVVSSDSDPGSPSNPAELIVDKAEPNVVLEISPTSGTFAYGVDRTLTATITGKFSESPDGTVEFFSGSSPLGSVPVTSGTPPIVTAVLGPIVLPAAGYPHSLKAVFTPGGSDMYYFSAESTPFVYDVKKTDQSKPIVEDPGSKEYGDDDFVMPYDDNGAPAVGGYEWLSSHPDIAEIDVNSGEVTILGAGKTEITVRKKGNNVYNDSNISDPFELTIAKATPIVVSWPTVSLTYGTQLKDAEVLSGNAIFEFENGSEIVVDGTFVFDDSVKETRPQVSDSNSTEYNLIFKPNDVEDFYEVMEPSKVTVAKKELTPILENATVTYGDNTYLFAITTPFDDQLAEGETETSLPGFTRPEVKIDDTVCPHGIYSPSGEYSNALVTFGGVPTANYSFKDVTSNLIIEPAEIHKGFDYETSTPDNVESGEWFNKEDIDNDNPFRITPIINSINNLYDQITAVDPASATDGDWKSFLEYADETANGNVEFWLRNEATEAVSLSSDESYKIDKTNVSNFEIDYNNNLIKAFVNTLTFGQFFKETVEVTIYAYDQTSGVKNISYAFEDDSGSWGNNTKDAEPDPNRADTYFITFDIEPQFRGRVKVTDAVDLAANRLTAAEKEELVDNLIIIDTIAPVLNGVEYDAENRHDHQPLEDEPERYYYFDDFSTTISITEANFDAIIDENLDPVISLVSVEKDGEDYVDFAIIHPWTKQGDTDEWTQTIGFTEEGEYVITIAFTDRSGNIMTYTNPAEEVLEAYVSAPHIIDRTPPEIYIEYDNNEALQDIYFNSGRQAFIQITERNFRPSDVVILVTAEDIAGIDLEDVKPQLSEWESDGDVHTATLLYIDDAIYTFYIEYTDLAGNSNEDVEEGEPFVNYDVDTIAPEYFCVDMSEPDTLQIQYDTNPLKSFINAISFGLFFQNSVTVTIFANDYTSGIDEISYSYDVGSDTGGIPSPINTGSDGKIIINEENITRDVYTHSATFNIPAQFKGYVTAEFKDRAGNSSGDTTADGIVVVDNIAPVMPENPDATDGYVKYNPVRIVRHSNLTDIPSVEPGNSILYFDGDIAAEVTIIEANFFPEDVIVTVEKRNEDNSIEIYETMITDWNPATPDAPNDTYVGTLTLSGDGDYIIMIDYTDRSGNTMATYTSERLTIDTKAPIISVSYDNNAAENGKYFKAVRTATITIIERNFRADDVRVTITAQNISGRNVSTPNHAANLRNRSAWSPNYDVNWHTAGDVHTATITYNVDANYTFSIGYTDLAGHSNDSVNYGNAAAPTEFTIDRAEPTDLTITYDRNPISEFLNTITFNFFQPRVTVTLSANDETAGIAKFSYSYDIEEDASNINTGGSGSIEVGENRNSNQTVTFQIEPQYRGHVEATATDRATNFATGRRPDILVIDDIAPIITVTYDNNDAINENYYRADRAATIRIEEANFYAEDVIITVGTKSSPTASYTYNRVEPSFTKNGDVYTAVVEFRESTHYSLEVQYTDKSDNVAIPFETDEFTIDKESPVIEVIFENTVANSVPLNDNYFNCARKATIIVTEHNWNPADFVLTLRSKEKINDNYQITDNPSLGEWSSAGDEHTAEILFNEDGFFALTMSYSDMAGNTADYSAEDIFCIDLTNPQLDDEKAINGKISVYREPVEDEASVSLTFVDTNFSHVDYTVTAHNYSTKVDGEKEIITDNGIIIYEIVDIGSEKNSKHERELVSLPDNYFSKNGVYELKAKAYDMAGNDSGEVGHTYVTMRDGITMMAYIPEETLSVFNGIGMQAIHVPDIPIRIVTLIDESSDSMDFDIYFGETLFIHNEDNINSRQIADNVMEHIVLVSSTFITSRFNEDGQSYDIPILVTMNNQATMNEPKTRRVGQLIIDNEDPYGEFEEGFVSGTGYYGVSEKEVKIIKLSDDIDENRTIIEVNGQRVDKYYDAVNHEITFVLEKSKAYGHTQDGHEIKVTLIDMAGNENHLEVVRDIYVGDWIGRYWIFFVVGGVIGAGIIGSMTVAMLRKNAIKKAHS